MRITSAQYLETQEDVKKAGADPLHHVLSQVIDGGETRCLKYPDALDTPEGQRKYYEIRPDVCEAYFADYGLRGALVHYLRSGWLEDMDKHFQPVPPGPTPPSPGGWKPPTATGLHEICSRPGGFFMSGLRISDGFYLGTYRYNGQAKLLRFNGQFFEEVSLPVESVYHFSMPPDNLPLFTTECPAQVYKRSSQGWERRFFRPEAESVAFEIHKVTTGLSLQTVDKAWGTNTRMIAGDENGNVWTPRNDISGKRLTCSMSDGKNEYLAGSMSDGTAQDFPVLTDINGNIIRTRKEHFDCSVYNGCVSNGIFSLGMAAVKELRGHRNAYFDRYDGTHWMSVGDLVLPWLMRFAIDPATGHRYALCSVWNEPDHATSQLLMSTNNGVSWKEIASLPMPAALHLIIADGGVYIIGGKYNEYGKVLFFKA